MNYNALDSQLRRLFKKSSLFFTSRPSPQPVFDPGILQFSRLPSPPLGFRLLAIA
jgi:hypothetical protein